MNRAGRSPRPRISTSSRSLTLRCFHDEIDLPPAKVRVKVGGGIAGHNGLRSISEHIGNDYRRVPHRRRASRRQGHGATLRAERFRQRASAPGSMPSLPSLPTTADLIVRGEDGDLSEPKFTSP